MNQAADKIRQEVFECEHCAKLGAFTRSLTKQRFYKFPPIIGAPGKAELLFIGINPRRNQSNQELHDWLMESPENFAKLASNRLALDEPYIAAAGKEEHYHCHMIVIEGVFGPGTTFEAVAAVTELMHCASVNQPAMLSRERSPCGELYLKRVMDIVKPQVVVAVGSGVRRHLETHFRDVIRLPVIKMEHPSQLFGKIPKAKLHALQPKIDSVRERLGDRACCI